jgi:hypothetical protein
VWITLRPATRRALRRQTLDIDLVIDVAPEALDELVQAVRGLTHAMQINVEEASPGHFIPLPAGHEGRHEFIGRFGQLDVFHFDLYSAALSKVARGREQDFADALALPQHGRLEWPKLKGYYQEIRPQFGQRSLKQNPAEFDKNFAALAALWRGAGGQP